MTTSTEMDKKFFETCEKAGIPIENDEEVTLTKVWIIKREERTPVRWAPGPGISKAKLYSLPRDTLVYLDGYGFQTALFLQQHSVDYNNGTLRIVRAYDFKKSLEEL